MLNKIILMGRLTHDPEKRVTTAGVPVCSFTLAVERDTQDKEVDFIDCVAWRKTADFVAQYLCKGKQIVAVGSLNIRTWTDKDGNNRRNAEINCERVYFADAKPNAGDFAPVEPSADDPFLP